MPFFLNFYIQALLSIVSFCVKDVFNFHLTDEEELRQFGTYMAQYFVLIHNAFIGVFDSYLPLDFNS